MPRIWKSLIIAAVIGLLLVGGKYTGFAILALLMPVYSLLLASLFFLIFLVLAAIIVPIGRYLVDRNEHKVRTETTTVIEDEKRAA